MVYIISKENKALMPCSNVIARLLLKQRKAEVKSKQPFTIKLLYETTNYIQDLTLGVDTGSGTIGTAVATDNCKIIYASEVVVRNDITDKMTQRAKYRRNRRNRKTRYRKSRFLNRKNSIKADRFSPTMVSKLHSHVKEIEYIKSILPIKTLVLETGQFDPHLMKNPELKYRPWGYQKGKNYGFANTKEMVLNRDNYTCQYCKGKHKDSKLEVHHIIYRSNHGSDDESNLITLCQTCHKMLHNEEIELNLKGKSKGMLKYATQMNSIRKQLLRIYPEAIETFGFVTKENRLSIDVDKHHYLDACVIATGGTGGKEFEIYSDIYKKRCISKGDFQQTKGVRSEQKLSTKKIYGFRKFDKVKYFGKEYFIKGRMSTGYAILMGIDGNKTNFSGMPKGFKTVKLSNCRRILARKSQLIAIHPNH